MQLPDPSLLEFLIVSQCRVREHYLLKLRECLAVLGEEQLWSPIDGADGHTFGGLIRHILEHPRDLPPGYTRAASRRTSRASKSSSPPRPSHRRSCSRKSRTFSTPGTTP